MSGATAGVPEPTKTNETGKGGLHLFADEPTQIYGLALLNKNRDGEKVKPIRAVVGLCFCLKNVDAKKSQKSKEGTSSQSSLRSPRERIKGTEKIPWFLALQEWQSSRSINKSE